MPSHISLPTSSAGSGPRPRPTADAFGATDSAPNVKDEPRESAAAAPASGEAPADRAAGEVFGSEDNARSTAGRIMSPVASWERHEHEKPPAVWLSDEFRRYPDLWTGGAGIDAPRGIKDIVDSGHVDRIIGSSGAESLQGGAGNGPMYPS